MSQTIFITGASSGIGKATVKHFQQKGWNVVATMRNTNDGEEFANEENVLVLPLDVTNEKQIKEAVNKAVEVFGGINVLLNNAGYGLGGPLEAISMEKIRRQFDVNVFGLLAVTQAVLPTMRKQKSGTIVNISSIGGRVTLPMFSLYHGTKWGVEGITEGLQYELDPLGIKVRIVEPGAIKTDFAGRSLDFNVDPTLPDYQPTINTLMSALNGAVERGSSPELVAQVIDDAIHGDELRYLAGDDAQQMMQARNQMNDKEFKNVMKERFGLE